MSCARASTKASQARASPDLLVANPRQIGSAGPRLTRTANSQDDSVTAPLPSNRAGGA
jgi:hypothetical protein